MLNRDGFLGQRRDEKTPQRNPMPTGGSASPAPEVRSPLGTPAQQHKAAPATEEKGSKLIVGPDIKLKGEITDCDTVVVEGRVEATTDSRLLQIADKGSFKGKVGIDVAEIRGRFEGELTAREKLVVFSTGVVSGKIRYGKIVIEEGGEVSGDVCSLASAKEQAPSGESTEGKSASDLWLAHDQKNKSQSPAAKSA